MSKNILVVGAGAWGTAIANVLSKNNNKVYLWTRDKKLSIKINSNKINQKFIIIFFIFYQQVHLRNFPKTILKIKKLII